MIRLADLAAIYAHGPDAADSTPWAALLDHAARSIPGDIRDRITPTANPEPYASAGDMFQAFANPDREILISSAYCDHPIWSPESNVTFRAWHDWEHYRHQCDFSRFGELRLYRLTLPEIPQAARPAIRSESLLQLAYAAHTGGFLSPQRCVS